MESYTNYECSICNNDYDEVITKPFTIVPCGHLYCEICLNKLKNSECPECRVIIEKIIINRPFLNLINEIKIKNNIIKQNECLLNELKRVFIESIDKIQHSKSPKTSQLTSLNVQSTHNSFVSCSSQQPSTSSNTLDLDLGLTSLFEPAARILVNSNQSSNSLFKNIEKIEKTPKNSFILNSSILTKPHQYVDLIRLCGFNLNCKFTLLYRATRDGFSADNFHVNCDHIPKTLAIIKVKENIFGGYTEASWDRESFSKFDKNAFVFSLTNQENQPIKMKTNDPDYSIVAYDSYGVVFGCNGGNDILICSDSNTSNQSYSELGSTYSHPKYAKESSQAKIFLAGSKNFCTNEIEIYKID